MADTLTEIQTVDTQADGNNVKLEIFSGPLDLLLHLIKQEEVNIYDIPIARITSQYLRYVEMMEELDLEVAGEFILMAATLIRIKTRLLLPHDEFDSDEPDMAASERILFGSDPFRQCDEEPSRRASEVIDVRACRNDRIGDCGRDCEECFVSAYLLCDVDIEILYRGKTELVYVIRSHLRTPAQSQLG